jgi:hypothetical protein
VRRELMPVLDDYIAHGLTDDYYEVAFSNAIAKGAMRMHVLRTGDRWWTEIDTVDELAQAEAMGAVPSAGRLRGLR